MYYGDEKIRQMARSLLPSTHRNRARKEKRLAKKKHKTKNRQLLHKGGDWDEIVFSSDRLSVRDAVKARQEGDKVGSFMNWVKAKTKDLPQIDRKAYVRGLLPDNLVGYHAMTHLPYKGFDHPNVDYVQSLPKRPPRYVYKRGPDGRFVRVPWTKKWKDWTREELYVLVRRALGKGYHAELNKSISHSIAYKKIGYDAVLRQPIMQEVGPLKARLCLGLHDVESFVNDAVDGLKGEGGRHPEWLSSLEEFLKTI